MLKNYTCARLKVILQFARDVGKFITF